MRFIYICIFFFWLLKIQAQHVNPSQGHYEIQIDYDMVQGDADAGWQFSVGRYDGNFDYDGNLNFVELDPSSVRFIAAPETQRTIQHSGLSRLGNIGDPIWILPQNNNPDMLFLGIRTLIDPGIFQGFANGFFFPNQLGSINLEMTSVTGSGPDNGGSFAMWETRLGGLKFHFDSSDGIDDSDRLETLPIGGHTHYNWSMTQPGTYEVTFRASGRINSEQGQNSNQDTSGEATFTFVVPVPEPSTVGILMGSSALLFALVYKHNRRANRATQANL